MVHKFFIFHTSIIYYIRYQHTTYHKISYLYIIMCYSLSYVSPVNLKRSCGRTHVFTKLPSPLQPLPSILFTASYIYTYTQTSTLSEATHAVATTPCSSTPTCSSKYRSTRQQTWQHKLEDPARIHIVLIQMTKNSKCGAS